MFTFAFIHLFVGFERIVQMLIKKGANLNAVNEDKFSALVIAAFRGNILNMFNS